MAQIDIKKFCKEVRRCEQAKDARDRTDKKMWPRLVTTGRTPPKARNK